MVVVQLVAVIALTQGEAISGADAQSQNCEISIRRIGVSPSSHASATMPVVVKVGWIGNDEHIESVGFYGFAHAHDLGNDASCYPVPGGQDGYFGGSWRIMTPNQNHYAREWGEYGFSFPIRSGSVVTHCPGYEYSWQGSFFVKTTHNTWWINPEFDSSRQFAFNREVYTSIERLGIWSGMVSTEQGEFRSYNPAGCR